MKKFTREKLDIILKVCDNLTQHNTTQHNTTVPTAFVSNFIQKVYLGRYKMKNLQKSLLLLVLLTFSGCQLEWKKEFDMDFPVFDMKFLDYFGSGYTYVDTDGDKHQYFKSGYTLGGYEYEGHYIASEDNPYYIGNFGTFKGDGGFTTNLIATVDTTTSNITIEKVPTEITFSYEGVDYKYYDTDKSLDATDISYEFFCVGGVHYGYDGTEFRFFKIGTDSVKVAEAPTSTEIVGDNNYIINYDVDGDIRITKNYDNIIIYEGYTVSGNIRVERGHTIGNIINYGTVTGDIVNYGTVTGDIYNYGTVISRIGNYSSGTVGNIYNYGTVTGDIRNYSTVVGNIYNYGTVTDIYNDRTVTDIVNFGTVSDYIINYGTVTDIVNFGTVDYINNDYGGITGDIYETEDEIYTYLDGSTERIDEVISYFEFVDIDFVKKI